MSYEMVYGFVSAGMAITHQMNFGKQLQWHDGSVQKRRQWRRGGGHGVLVQQMKIWKNNDETELVHVCHLKCDDKLQIHQMKQHMLYFC